MNRFVNRKNMLIYILNIVICIFILQACTGKGPSKQAAPQKQSQTVVKPTPEIQEAKLDEEKVYIYAKKGKRDPFVPLVVKAKETVLKLQSPLESYDVGAIKILGIIQSDKLRLAEAMLPDGKAYTLKEGMTIGIHGGKINKITKDSVVVSEQVKDYKGQLKTKETILRLREEED
jgi:Tfp pilus assembly protein PilP